MILNYNPKIAGAGICCLDHIITAPAIKYGDSTHISKYVVQGGGKTATAMAACSRLGAMCKIFSIIGNDSNGKQIEQGLISEGIDISGITKINCADSPFSIIHVNSKTGERTIFHRREDKLLFKKDSFDFSPIKSYSALLVDDCFMELAISAAVCANEYGVKVIADLIPESRDNIELLKHVDILIAPNHFVQNIGCEKSLNKALEKIHSYGPKTAVITLGNKGWICSDESGIYEGKAFKIDAIDTTGAGDAFHGAFAFALSQGWNTKQCCTFASAVSAIKCTKPGGRNGLPNINDTLNFLRTHNKELSTNF